MPAGACGAAVDVQQRIARDILAILGDICQKIKTLLQLLKGTYEVGISCHYMLKFSTAFIKSCQDGSMLDGSIGGYLMLLLA